jgi:hypothetical protein
MTGARRRLLFRAIIQTDHAGSGYLIGPRLTVGLFFIIALIGG